MMMANFNSTQINNTEKQELFTQVKHRLGAPLRKIELKDEMMDSLLVTSIQDYAHYVQNWLIESQWSSVIGLDVSNADITRALITRTFDWEDSFTYAYSKIVGLQVKGPWELKKDFIQLTRNQQTYTIPAGREVNEVLWLTPPYLNQATIDPFLGVWNFHFGADQVGLGALYVQPAFDVLLRAADRNIKQRILRSELTYKITGGPNGTKHLHLMSVPGGRFDFGSSSININQFRVWYWYYDTTDRKKCLEENKDIVKLPSDIPLNRLDWIDLNDPTKNWVRRYFTALCKETLGRVRGKFGGSLKVPESELTMDYSDLLSEGKEEQSKLIEEIREFLERLRNDKMLERKAQEAENLNKLLSFRPMQYPFLLI